MNFVAEIESVKEAIPYFIVRYKSGYEIYVDYNEKNRELLSQYIER